MGAQPRLTLRPLGAADAAAYAEGAAEEPGEPAALSAARWPFDAGAEIAVWEPDPLRNAFAVEETGRLVGIVSHRDWRRARARGVSPAWESEPISRIMTDEPVTVAAETSVRWAARVLLERKIGCLPVRAGDRIVGIFTTSDALEALLSALG